MEQYMLLHPAPPSACVCGSLCPGLHWKQSCQRWRLLGSQELPSCLVERTPVSLCDAGLSCLHLCSWDR